VYGIVIPAPNHCTKWEQREQIRLPVFSASSSVIEANGQFHAATAFIPRKCTVKMHWKHA